MADRNGHYVIGDLRGGRNGADPPWSLSETQCADAVNVEYYRSTCGAKRNGMTSASVTFSAGGPFSGLIGRMYRHVPGTDETAAELWAIADGAGPLTGRMAGATTFTAPTFKDAVFGLGYEVSWASNNGKLFMAYASATPTRLHVWDGSTVRRAGIDPGASAPTVADSGGAGAYVATVAYYRVRFVTRVSSITTRRSEPTPSVKFTPSGANASITVTRPTAPSEGETHWEIEISADDITYVGVFGDFGYLGANPAVAIASTTQVIAAAVTDLFAGGDLAPELGTYTLQKPYRFIAADQGRLIGFGSFRTTDRQNDIEISAAVGSLDVSDTERVDTNINYRISLDENDSGPPTGLCGPVFGNYYAFKAKQFWELVPTGSPDRPYRATKLSSHVGCVGGQASCVGEDQYGNACLYVMSQKGMYRYGAGGYTTGSQNAVITVGGLQYIGKGIEDYVQGPTATINLAAAQVVACMLYYADKRQVYVWWATGSNDNPNVGAIYHVETGGWTRIPAGDVLAAARCCAMWPATIAASMSRELKPYIAKGSGGSAVIYKCDDSSVTQDDGTNYQASITTKAIEPGGSGFHGSVGDAVLLAKAASGVTITATVSKNFGAETKTGSALLTLTADEGSATRVSRRLEDSSFAGCQFVQYTLGDASAINNTWNLDRLVMPYHRQEAVGQ